LTYYQGETLSNLLIIYPHGLGDCVQLTPVLRNYFFNTGKKAAVATLERFKSAEFFNHNPYVGHILYTKDAWNDYDDPDEGFRLVQEECERWGRENGYDKVVMPMHKDWSHHKILLNFKYCDVKPTSIFTEVFTSDEDKRVAREFVKNLYGDEPYGFAATKSGRPAQTMPAGYGRKWLQVRKGLKNVLEVDVEFGIYDYNFNVQIEMMRMASALVLPDSAFPPAASAMGKPVDHMYIAPQWGPRGYNRIKPLHSAVQNINYVLDQEIMEML